MEKSGNIKISLFGIFIAILALIFLISSIIFPNQIREVFILGEEGEIRGDVGELASLLPGGEEYVPVPDPANTGDYKIGAFYMPPIFDSWDIIDDFPERRPLLGYHNEGDPEVMDWEIKWAQEHGIGFFVFDWYRCISCFSSPQPITEDNIYLKTALDSFFSSRYGNGDEQNDMKFAIMITTHMPLMRNFYSLEDTQDTLMPFIIENYFSKSNYLKINNKPVLFVYNPYTDGMVSELGIEEPISAEDIDHINLVLDSMRQKSIEAGYDGLVLLSSSATKDVVSDPSTMQWIQSLGFDHAFSYVSPLNVVPELNPTDQQIINYHIEAFNNWAQVTSISPDYDNLDFIFTTAMGWDRTPNNPPPDEARWKLTPSSYQTLLENIKSLMDGLTTQSSAKNILMLGAWNEIAEGNHLMPHEEYGFGYLEAIRNVFSDKANIPDYRLPEELGLGPYDSFYQMLDLPRTPELVGHYNFEGNANDVSVKSSGNQYHGDVYGAVLVQGKIGQGYYLDGIDDYIEILDNPEFEGTDSISFGGWFKIDEFATDPVIVIGKGISYRALISSDGSGHCVVGTENGGWYAPGTPAIWPAGTINTGQWHHIMCIYNGSSVKAYVDGSEVGSSTTSISGKVGLMSRELVIGARVVEGTDWFKGSVDEVKIWNYALSESEILEEVTRTEGEPVESQTYYVDATNGNDNNDGLSEISAWQTISKVNNQIFNPGDLILFKRGEVWNEGLIISSSGSKDNLITFGAYGIGNKPILNLAKEITGWVVDSGNVYVADVDFEMSQVFVDEKRVPISHYPDDGFMIIDGNESGDSFYDNDLNILENLVGTEIQIRTRPWIWDRKTITNYIDATKTIKFDTIITKSSKNSEGYGYVLVGEKWMLDSPGEWYFDDINNKLYIWLEDSSDPNAHLIEASNYDHGIYSNKTNDVKVENIEIKNSGRYGVELISPNNFTLKDLNVLRSRRSGIDILSPRPYDVPIKNNLIINNLVNDSVESGIWMPWRLVFENNIIENNTISNVFTEVPMTSMVPEYFNRGTGLKIGGKNNIVKNNHIFNIGYNCIANYGDHLTIEKNLLRNCLLVLDDGAGIYSHNNNHVIKDNIIINMIGNTEGKRGVIKEAHGIYPDEKSNYLEIYNNTIINTNYGIFIHNSLSHIIKGNTVYKSDLDSMLLSGGQSRPVNNVVLENNIFYSPSSINSIKLSDYGPDWISSSDKNYFTQPYYNEVVERIFEGVTTYFTLPEFQTEYGFEINSKDLTGIYEVAKPNCDDSIIFVNKKSETQVFNLDQDYCDLDGNVVSGSITLEPFRSQILLNCFCNNDDVCNNRETCATCPADCGECSPVVPRLLFKSGFENVSIVPNQTIPGTIHRIEGIDSETGFVWPADLPGNGSRNLFNYIISADKDLSNFIETRVESVIGHDGQSTSALYQEVKGDDPDRSPITRIQYNMYPEENDDALEEMYVKYWIKLQPNLDEVMPDSSWRALMELRAKEYRFALNVVRKNTGGDLVWRLISKWIPGGDVDLLIFNETVEVPVGEWFLLEAYWRHTFDPDGTIFVRVNRDVIFNFTGQTKKVGNIRAYNIFKVYGRADYMPSYQWIDDVEIWSSLPEDSCGNTLCEADLAEDCSNCPQDCGECSPVCTPGLETCNGLDDDCDGKVDEGLTKDTTCGVGACTGNTGFETCVNGIWGGDNCDSFAGASPDDNCNGIDDDCDGTADEHYIETETSCGVGICSGNSGILECIAGVESNTCDPYEGAVEESCEDDTGYDRLDNNCDGNVDLDCESYCDNDGDGYTPHLVCLALLYAIGDCDDENALINPGMDELCDNIDNDCTDDNDGEDEVWFGEVTSCGVGECLSSGEKSCVNGLPYDDCVEGTPNSDENCDGLDNDCDNDIDEDYIEQQTICGVGECSTTGLLECIDAEEIDSCIPLLGSEETCNGLNDDCDDETDEGCDCLNGNTQQCGSKDEGECSFGEQVCVNGQWGDCVDEIVPVEEICNGLDDDCDGKVDEEEGLCDDGISCSVDICSNGECSYTQNDASCNDGAYCNGNEWCSLDEDCVAGTAVSCSDNYDCTVDSCEESIDDCIFEEDDNLCSGDMICDILNFPNTGCGSLENCEDADNDGLLDYDSVVCVNGIDQCPYTNKTYFINNPNKLTDYYPIASRFSYSSGINAINIFNFENFTIRSDVGEIVFENLSLVNINEVGCFERLNFTLTEIIEVSKEKIFLNSTIFEGSAIIEFIGVNYSDPIIKKDGSECPEDECEIINYTAGEFLRASVTGLVTFEVGENETSNDTGDGGDGGGNGDGDGNGGNGGGSPSTSTSCNETWTCSGWSECINNKQTKTCRDMKNCGTTLKRPLLEQGCQPIVDEEDGEIVEDKDEKEGTSKLGLYIFLILLGLFGVAAVILFLRYIRTKPKQESMISIKSSKDIKKARGFVEKARKKGLTDEQIKELFRKKGWSERTINQIFQPNLNQA